MAPGLNQSRRSFYAGGSGIGIVSLPAKAHLMLTADDMKRKLRVLRKHSGDFLNTRCDYKSLWQNATNCYLATDRTLGNICGLSRQAEQVEHSNGTECNTGRRNNTQRGMDSVPVFHILRFSSISRELYKTVNREIIKKTPNREIIPRLKNFPSADAAVLFWRTDSQMNASGALRSRDLAPLSLMTAEMRRKAFNTEQTSYSNTWWRDCNKSAFDRLQGYSKYRFVQQHRKHCYSR